MALFRRRNRKKNESVETSAVPEEAEPSLLGYPPEVDSDGNRAVTGQSAYMVNHVESLMPFGMYVLDAWGTASCEDIYATDNLPTDDLVGLDGYAVRADDLNGGGPSILRLRADGKMVPNAAVSVSTGQPLPTGADAVVPAARVNVEGYDVTVLDQVRPGDNIRWAGCDVRAGAVLLANGDRLNARNSAVLALAGIDRVMARPRPRVVVLSVEDEEGLEQVDSHLLAAAVKADGCEVWRVPVVAGSETELRNTLSDQLIRADLVIATGDLSEESLLLSVVESLGELDVASVRMRPGGQLGFALVGDDHIPMLLVPDDPVAAYVTYVVFARPLIARLMGVPQEHDVVDGAVLGGELESSEGVVDVRFATLREESGTKVAVPLGRLGNPRIADMVRADALIVMGEDITHLGLGDRVECWLMRD